MNHDLSRNEAEAIVATLIDAARRKPLYHYQDSALEAISANLGMHNGDYESWKSFVIRSDSRLPKTG